MEHAGKYQRLVTFVAAAFVVASLYLARAVLIPFALALLMSFLLGPVVARLQRWHFSRLMAVIATGALVLLVFTALGWLVAGQAADLAAELPGYKQSIQAKLVTLRDILERPVQQATDTVKDIGDGLTPAADAVKEPEIQTVRIATAPVGPFEMLRNALAPTIDIILTVAMAFLFAFVMLLRRDDLRDRLIRLMGGDRILVTTQALDEASKSVSSYLARLLLLNGLHGAAVGILLTLVGVPNALLWGLLASILRFIPYVGPWISALFPVLTTMATSPDWSQTLLTISVLALLELISNSILEPWIYGKGTGISPLALLITTLFWTWLWGAVGLILATPLTVCLVVLGKHMPRLQFLYILFGDEPALPPPQRLYQRLLAGQQDQAWSVLEEERGEKPLHELYDTVVLPALAMAERDRQRGALDATTEARIDETVQLLVDEAAEPHAVAAASAVATAGALPLPKPFDLNVLCLPAHGHADELAATMLRQVLELDGVHVAFSPLADLVGETLQELGNRSVDLVCISAVPPARFMHVRYLCKRIAGRFPGLPIVVGMWTLEEQPSELAERIRKIEGVSVVATLGEARTLIAQLAETARSKRAAREAEAAAASA